jgi:hypothetical protein
MFSIGILLLTSEFENSFKELVSRVFILAESATHKAQYVGVSKGCAHCTSHKDFDHIFCYVFLSGSIPQNFALIFFLHIKPGATLPYPLVLNQLLIFPNFSKTF